MLDTLRATASCLTALLSEQTEKKADPILSPEEHNAWLRHDALKDVLTWGALAGVTGAGIKTTMSLPYLFGRRKKDPNRPITADEVPVYEPALQKAAGPEEAGGFWPWLMGHGATEKAQMPLYLGGMTAATIGGLAGGHALAGSLIEKKRKADLAAELEDARTEYRNALVSNYAPKAVISPPHLKTAEDCGTVLDRLADELGVDAMSIEKAAETGAQMFGRLASGYGAFAVPVAALSGLAAYKYTKSRSDDELLEKALKERQRLRAAQRPPEVYAVPEPVTMDRQHNSLMPLGGPLGG